jgi:hypothetical protein
MDEFTAAYIECALWSSNDETDEQGGAPLDANYCADDIDPATLATMVEDCRRFQEQNAELIRADLVRAGHDFWLTRNHHGAGFWDGDWPEDGATLTEHCKAYPEVSLYVHNGSIYAI